MTLHKKNLLTLFLMLLSIGSIWAQNKPLETEQSKQWVDSVFNSLNPVEKVGQLIMIRAHSDKSTEYHEQVANQIRNQKVGGLCFFQGGPGRQISLVNYYQSISKTPLFISIDGEWGLAMRLDSVMPFPRQMTLGAIQDDSLIFKMGVEVARQCKAAGVNLNFAPVVDVNNNASNPVINSRSFGENPTLVAYKSSLYMQGMQSQHLLTCAKHFPGHGDTDTDSHHSLPFINADRKSIDSIHLYPFKELITSGISSIMVAHLHIPAIDTTSNLPSTLSPKVVTEILRNELGYKGMIFTDALEMKGVANYVKPGELEVRALEAGIDVLLMPENTDTAIAHILQAFQTGRLDSNDIYKRVKRILFFKYFADLNKIKPINIDQSINIIEDPHLKFLQKELMGNALTLLKNDDNLLPLSTNRNLNVAVVSVGTASRNSFSNGIKNYRSADLYSIQRDASDKEVKQLLNDLKEYDVVIMGVFSTNQITARNYGVYNSTYQLAKKIGKHSKLIINFAGNPYAIQGMTDIDEVSAFLLSYQDYEAGRAVSAEAIMGAKEINGKLPVSIGKGYEQGSGLELKKKRINRLEPEELGLDFNKIKAIDSVAIQGLEKGAYPGCQILMAKSGTIFYQKNFGFLTQEQRDSVTDTTLYDIASVSKVMGTTLAIMKLVDQGRVDVNKRVDFYLPELSNSNKGKLLLKDILTHQAGLPAGLPFYQKSLLNSKPNPTLFRKKKSPLFEARVADSLYILTTFGDTIFQMLVNSKLSQKHKYVYSDLGMYILRRIVERQSGMTQPEFLAQEFYSPLGLQYTLYNPLDQFSQSQIAPTEVDRYFRFDTIQGTVHDQASALMGGVEGHAGLFSNTNDLAIIAQLLLQNGSYGGTQYLKPEVVKSFTRQQFPKSTNRRGLGFDRPIPNHQKGGPSSHLASAESYGHTGFTGTFVWIDPTHDLVMIFLSNRTFPSSDNKKLIQMGIRTEIHTLMYQACGINN